jgi:hypothetical protein
VRTDLGWQLCGDVHCRDADAMSDWAIELYLMFWIALPLIYAMWQE